MRELRDALPLSAWAWAALALGALACAGCGVACDPTGTSCPTPTSVRGHCQTEETCERDGVPEWCVTGDCRLERGTTLTVPLDGLALSATPELFVDYLDVASGAPDPIAIDARLDGMAGTAARAPETSPHAAVVSWRPLPAAPKVLTLRFDDGAKASVDPNLQFEDAACEAESGGACAAP